MKKLIIAGIVLTLFAFAKCNKAKIDTNGLPPATQEGKNTFGFLLNGQPWMPQGNNGTANLSIYYDPAYRGGVFNIAAYKIYANGNRQRITIASDSIQGPQHITFGHKNFTVLFRSDLINECDYLSNDSLTSISGFCDITKIDVSNRIFSGTFYFIFSRSNCNTINITDGRFDMKY